MSQQFIEVGVTGGTDAANIINGNFTELYNSIALPLKFPGQSASFQFNMPANSQGVAGFVVLVSGAISVNIGLTPGGNDFTPDPIVPDANGREIGFRQYFAALTTIYVTITGGGTGSFRFNIIPNFY